MPADTPESREEHELRAMELYHQLVNLSPDTGNTDLIVTLRMPGGQYVGDVYLTRADTRDVTEALIRLVAYRQQESGDGTDPVEDALVKQQAARGLADLEAFLSRTDENGGQL